MNHSNFEPDEFADDLLERLLEFSSHRWGLEMVDQAFGHFLQSTNVPAREAKKEMELYLTWFQFHYQVPGTNFASVAQAALETPAFALTPVERAYLESATQAPFAFYQVTDQIRDGICRLSEIGWPRQCVAAFEPNDGDIGDSVFFGKVVNIDGQDTLRVAGEVYFDNGSQMVIRTSVKQFSEERDRGGNGLPTHNYLMLKLYGFMLSNSR